MAGFILKSTLVIIVLLVVVNSNVCFSSYNLVYSQNTKNKNSTNSNSWTSKADDLSITMHLEPKIPIIDKQTKITFEIKNFNNTGYVKNITAAATITDSDGRLFKFNKQQVSDGKYSINYIFPSSGEDKIILQLYKNNLGFALASFDIKVPSTSNNTTNNIFSGLFKIF